MNKIPLISGVVVINFYQMVPMCVCYEDIYKGIYRKRREK